MTKSSESSEPVLHKEHQHKADRFAAKALDHTGKWQEKVVGQGLPILGGGDHEKKGPAGGWDGSPVPQAPAGYTLKFTIHRAEHLPFADIGSFSSDPYVLAVLTSALPKRHKQDTDLNLRTPTIHRNTSPEWNTEWIVGNVPASGCILKCRLFDEDPADRDDRLGNVTITIPEIDSSWKGFQKKRFEVKKRMGSKRAYTFRGCAALISKRIKMGATLIVSTENLGQTSGEHGGGGRMYTMGPLPWSRHFSPMIGRIAGTKDESTEDKHGRKTEKYKYAVIHMLNCMLT